MRASPEMCSAAEPLGPFRIHVTNSNAAPPRLICSALSFSTAVNETHSWAQCKMFPCKPWLPSRNTETSPWPLHYKGIFWSTVLHTSQLWNLWPLTYNQTLTPTQYRNTNVFWLKAVLVNNLVVPWSCHFLSFVSHSWVKPYHQVARHQAMC